MKISDIQKQKAEWKRKGWSIPELRGGKQVWFVLVVELVHMIEKAPVADLSLSPDLHSVNNTYPWRVYAPFLKGVGLVCNKSGVLSLTDIGLEFYHMSSQKYLATLLHDRYRLFGEILELLESSPKTVEEVDKELRREYCLDWANLSNTRRRMDWLEVLGLIQSVGNRKWGLTQEGENVLQEWPLITSDVVDTTIVGEEISIAPSPTEIQELLVALNENALLHKKRNTYNMWVPSPNRIENLRTIIQFSFERVSRAELFKFIEEEYGLKTSSVESMMPFMKADGLLEEVGRNIYVATPAAKAWCDSGNDLDFIRILHAHKRFVGEMIVAAENVVTRNEIYEEAKKYGINIEKARWIMGFLLEAGLLEETQYLHVKATPLGMKLSNELPLMESGFEEQCAIENDGIVKDNICSERDNAMSEISSLFEALCVAAKDPMAEGKASGVAFEENIAGVFRYMGFNATRIGGAGNTDVVVKWKDDEGKTIIAIVDGKSKSSGTVTHSDISDVAIETHKEKNNAEYVAIAGPGFSGDTIKNHARKKGFSLITDKELVDIAIKSRELGLSLTEISLLFAVPNGLSQLNELMITRKRELEIVSLVITTFKQEQDAMDSLSARDLYFLLRRTSISPSLEELINTFELLSKEEIGVLAQCKKSSSTENTTYVMQKEKQCVNRLRALADAIENGLE